MHGQKDIVNGVLRCSAWRCGRDLYDVCLDSFVRTLESTQGLPHDCQRSRLSGASAHPHERQIRVGVLGENNMKLCRQWYVWMMQCYVFAMLVLPFRTD